MKVNYKKYGMSVARYQELAGFARQYPEFVQERKRLLTGTGAVDKDGTAAADLKTKIDLIEKCVKTACFDCAEITPFLLRSVTEKVSYECLNVPMYRDGFLLRRRLFFIELDKHKK